MFSPRPYNIAFEYGFMPDEKLERFIDTEATVMCLASGKDDSELRCLNFSHEDVDGDCLRCQIRAERTVLLRQNEMRDARDQKPTTFDFLTEFQSSLFAITARGNGCEGVFVQGWDHVVSLVPQQFYPNQDDDLERAVEAQLLDPLLWEFTGSQLAGPDGENLHEPPKPFFWERAHPDGDRTVSVTRLLNLSMLAFEKVGRPPFATFKVKPPITEADRLHEFGPVRIQYIRTRHGDA